MENQNIERAIKMQELDEKVKSRLEALINGGTSEKEAINKATEEFGLLDEHVAQLLAAAQEETPVLFS